MKTMEKEKIEPRFFAILREDMRKVEINTTNIFAIFFYLMVRPGFLAVFLHRCAAACYGKGRLGRVASKFFWRLNVFINSCDIEPRAKIGPAIYLPHPMGVVIGPVVIGRNAMISQNVTLGIRRPSLTGPLDPKNYPNVGDNVCIYAGSVVMGGVKIGSGARIGANAVVTKDVPENYTAVGAPARMLPPKDLTHSQ